MKPTFWNCTVPFLPLLMAWIVSWLAPDLAGNWLILAGITVAIWSLAIASMANASDVELQESVSQARHARTKQRLDAHREDIRATRALMNPELKTAWNASTAKDGGNESTAKDGGHDR